MKLALLLSLLMIQGGLSAADPVKSVNQNRRGVALDGYDVVSYFDQGKPQKGSDQFTVEWMDATWRFASAKHRDAFAAEPEAYAPQFGGYCSYAVSEGYTASVDKDAWTIVGGKLYLNYNKKTRDLWLQDRDRRIRMAEQNWPRLHR